MCLLDLGNGMIFNNYIFYQYLLHWRQCFSYAAFLIQSHDNPAKEGLERSKSRSCSWRIKALPSFWHYISTYKKAEVSYTSPVIIISIPLLFRFNYCPSAITHYWFFFSFLFGYPYFACFSFSLINVCSFGSYSPVSLQTQWYGAYRTTPFGHGFERIVSDQKTKKQLAVTCLDLFLPFLSCSFSLSSFLVEDKREKLVIEYFQERYNISLRYASWPALQSGNEPKPIYLPMEVN